MTNKSKTCFRKDGVPLTEYYSENDAEGGAEDVNNKHGKKMIPYKCKKCEFWHLSPEDRHTPSRWCEACQKQLYASEEMARKRGKIIMSKEPILLAVYECEYDEGWHLTKNCE